jgi:glucose-6-phosphate isomerase
LLKDYQLDRSRSTLGRLLNTGRRLRELVDRVVVIGSGSVYLAARALFDSCCHPFHNELSRADRGGWPRMFFDGQTVDNDATQGLLDLLGHAHGNAVVGSSLEHAPLSIDERWALVLLSAPGDGLATALAFDQYYSSLCQSHGAVFNDRQAANHLQAARVAELVIPVTGTTDPLADLPRRVPFAESYDAPAGLDPRFGLFSAWGLLPAAILGLDLVALLNGARAMTDRFEDAEPGNNPALQLAGIAHLFEQRGMSPKFRTSPVRGLESTVRWAAELDNTLHQRSPTVGNGAAAFTTQMIVDHVRRDRLRVGPSIAEHINTKSVAEPLDALVGRSWPELLVEVEAKSRLKEDQTPTVDLHLPRMDEPSMGQLLQLLMLASVVKNRL